MFNSEELARIRRLLREGVAPEKIALQFQMSYTAWRARLMNSGYRVATVRDLEEIEAVELAPEPEPETVSA